VYYPVLLNLVGRRALVIGGGPVAARKARSLAQAGARVTAVSPEFARSFPRVIRVRRAFRPGDLAGARVVVCATDDADVQERVWRFCEARGIPVNVVDVPKRCSFIVPAQLRRGPLMITISTDGASPALSGAIRRKLERLFPPGVGRVVRDLGRRRKREPDSRRRKALAIEALRSFP
jgi:siroheme synthase-like protein